MKVEIKTMEVSHNKIPFLDRLYFKKLTFNPIVWPRSEIFQIFYHQNCKKEPVEMKVFHDKNLFFRPRVL